MTQEHIPVLIVGAGGAGLALSLLLNQQHISSLLVERRPDISWFPRARNLNFRTLEVFRGLGLEAEVIAAGTHVSQTYRKETLASPEREEFPAIEQLLHITDHLEILTPEPGAWYCPQSRLEPLLKAKALQRGAEVRYGSELLSFTQDETGVTSTIKNHTTGAISEVRSEYLLAADGAHSHVRSALGVKAEGLGVLDEHYIFVYFRADWGELIQGYESDAILIQTPEVNGMFLVTDKDRGMFTIIYTPSRGEAAQDYTARQCKEIVEKGMGKPGLAVEIVDIAPWQPAQQVAEYFQQGRVFLVGDAAHTMPPKLGLGANTAIQSAQNLAWKLAAVLHGQATPQLLSTYQAERHPVGRLVSEQSLVGPAASLLTKGGDDKLLPAEKRISLFSLMAGYRYRSEAIVSEDPPPSTSGSVELMASPVFTGEPGTRVPHLWLERGRQRISTLDLLDGRFVLLAGPDGAPWQKAARGAEASLRIDLAVYRIGTDGDLLDLENGWQTKMGMLSDGAVLVRPDGFVAWRSGSPPTSPEPLLEQVLAGILGQT